jgi:cholera toxin transcriptional activator
MPASPNNSRIARFGVFEADLNAGELRKSGVKLRLQGQPFLVLALLLERAGEVVTREDLRQKLWPSDTFVDFDHSLNTAINKVREALGDSASSPRYVETLARRGYRFVAPVEIPQPISQQSSKSDAAQDNAVRETADAPASIPYLPALSAPAAVSTTRHSVHPELDVPIPHRGLTRGLFVLSQVMYLIFYFVALRRLHAVQDIADSFLSPGGATALVVILMVTAGVGIPLRCYLISAAGFDHQRLGEKFRQIFPFVLILDELWAVAPFLLIQKIGLGAAFAVCAALLYLPFSERTLIRMAYLRSATSSPP